MWLDAPSREFMTRSVVPHLWLDRLQQLGRFLRIGMGLQELLQPLSGEFGLVGLDQKLGLCAAFISGILTFGTIRILEHRLRSK